MFVESVLRYGVPADFASFFAVPAPGGLDVSRATLCDAVLKACPRLQEQLLEDEGDEGDDAGGGEGNDRSLPFVCHYFKVSPGTAGASA